jgi:hypothetical protein
VIRLPGQLLQAATAQGEVPLFEKQIAVLDCAGLLAQIEPDAARLLDLPFGIVHRDVAGGLHFLRFPIELDLIGVEDHLLPLDLDVALAFDFGSLSRDRHGVRGEVDLLLRLCAARLARLSE